MEKYFFREHKLSRIALSKIFENINFRELGLNSRKSRNFLLVFFCVFVYIRPPRGLLLSGAGEGYSEQINDVMLRM